MAVIRPGYMQPPLLPITGSEWHLPEVGRVTVREVRRLSIWGDWRISAVVRNPKRVIEHDLDWWTSNALSMDGVM